MTLSPALIFLAGLVVITVGAEMILRGSSRIAALLGVRPIMIGLTVVAIGTSLPELAVGITAARGGQPDIAIGNIAGTNLMNILFILGISAAIRPLPLHGRTIRFDVPVMIAAAVVLLVMAIDGELSVVDGLILCAGSVVYYFFLVRLSKKESAKIRKEYDEEYSRDILLDRKHVFGNVGYVLMLVVGLVITVLGANLLVSGAVDIARAFGVSDAVIGLTIVAVGTSAPELATTVVATIKDDRDVAVGNLLGSSITNILVILGLTCVAANGLGVDKSVLRLDLPLAAAVAIACYPVFRSDKRVSRIEGIVFVSLYLIYLLTLVFLRT